MLGQLLVELGVNTAAFAEGMTKATYLAKKAGAEIESAFKEMGESVQALGIAFGALGPAGVALTEALSVAGSAAGKVMKEFAGVNKEFGVFAAGAAGIAAAATSIAVASVGIAVEVAESAKRMREQSMQAGMNTTDFQKYAYAASLAGVSQETFTASMARFGAKVGAAAQGNRVAAQGFEQMGVKIRDANTGALLPMTDILKQVADWSEKTADGAAKNALLTEVGSRGMKQMIPLLNQGSEGLQRAADEAAQLGVVLGEKDVAAMDEFTQDTIRLKAGVTGIANELTVKLMPTLGAFADEAVKAFKDSNSDLKLFIDGIAKLGQWFVDLVAIVAASVGEIGAFFKQLGASAVLLWEGLGNAAKKAVHGDFKGAMAEMAATGKAQDELDKQRAADSIERWKKVWAVIGGKEAPVPEPKKPEAAVKPIQHGGAEKPLQEVEKMIDALNREVAAHIELAAAAGQDADAQAEAKARIKGEQAYNAEADKLKEQKEQLKTQLAEMNAAGEQYTAEQKNQVQKRIAAIDGERAKLDANKSAIIDDYVEMAKADETAKTKDHIRAMQEEIVAIQNEQSAIGLLTEEKIKQEAINERLKYEAQHSSATKEQLDEIEADALAKLQAQYETQVKQKAAQEDLLTTYLNQAKVLQQIADDQTNSDGVRMKAAADLLALQEKTRQEIDQAAISSGNLGKAMLAWVDQVAAQVPKLGQQFMADMTKAFDSLNNALLDFITKGKVNLKSLGESIERDFLSTALKGVEGAIAGMATKQGAGGQGGKGGPLGALAEIFTGGKKSSEGIKPLGTQTDPLYTLDANSSGVLGVGGAASDEGSSGGEGDNSGGGGITEALGGIFSKITGALGTMMSSIMGVLSKIVSSIGSSIGSIFGAIFGGGKAMGGDVTPGKAYVVGEHHPEFFVPRQSGTVVPTLSLGGAKVNNVSVHFHGVADADTFKRSQSQILSQVTNSVGHAMGRR